MKSIYVIYVYRSSLLVFITICLFYRQYVPLQEKKSFVLMERFYIEEASSLMQWWRNFTYTEINNKQLKDKWCLLSTVIQVIKWDKVVSLKGSLKLSKVWQLYLFKLSNLFHFTWLMDVKIWTLTNSKLLRGKIGLQPSQKLTKVFIYLFIFYHNRLLFTKSPCSIWETS